MSLFPLLHQRVLTALLELTQPTTAQLDKIQTGLPKNPQFGDATTNAALIVGGKNVKGLAQNLAKTLEADPFIAKAEVAGPGFINLTLAPEAYSTTVKDILVNPDYGKPTLPAQKVHLEFVSANPTGPLHVGHLRGAVLGDTLANILTWAGHSVLREYYINDAGGQIAVLAQSAYKRYEAYCGKDVTIEPPLYPGAYLIPLGEELHNLYGTTLLDQPESMWMPKVQLIAVQYFMAAITQDLAALGIQMDSFFSESTLYKTNTVTTAIGTLKAKGLLREGTLPTEQGNGRVQTLFCSTQYGDDQDRAVQKEDGSWTYFAGDIAYHAEKLRRKLDTYITILGADHSGYVTRLKAIFDALSNGEKSLDIHLVQLVHLMDNGVPITMSKRQGTFALASELIEAVGPDAVRFHMLAQSNNSEMRFDLTQTIEKTRANPLYYIQYASGRCHSVLEKAKDLGYDTTPAHLLDEPITLTDPAQQAIIAHLATWPSMMANVLSDQAPHRLCTWLGQTAALFHYLWHQGHDNSALRLIPDGTDTSTLALTQATHMLLSQGLTLLGITPAKRL